MVSFVEFSKSVAIFEYPCGNESDCYPIHRKIRPGFYLFEVYGSQGGTENDAYSRGGYSRGIFHATQIVEIFLRIGSEGKCNTTTNLTSPHSFNGGGQGKCHINYKLACSGGGATDIRIQNDDLFHRIIVAGGGGGSTIYNSDTIGGPGGGEIGLNTTGSQGCTPGSGGTQTGGGKSNPSYPHAQGKFGVGGSVDAWDGGGGGGGWYGGGAGLGCVQGGGGGSGFVFSKSTLSIASSAGLMLDSSLVLRSGYTRDGSQEFPGLNDYLVHGHTGNGAIKIVFIGESNLFTCRQPSFLSMLPLILPIFFNFISLY